MSTNNIDERHRAFLLDLRELAVKHKLVVSGCGCCGSPSIEDIERVDPKAGYSYDYFIRWMSPDDEFQWKESGDKVVVP